MARPRTFDEGAVVRAARDRFWAGGYAATSVEDLSASTGLGKGSLYSAFGDKHALFVRALAEYSAAALDHATAQLRRTGVPAFERLSAHVRAMAAGAVADVDRRGCLMAKSAAELGGSDADVDRIVGDALRSWRDELVDCVIEAQADGDVASDVDPGALATMLLAHIRGCESLLKSGVRADLLTAAAEQLLVLVAARR
jgi:TetR/AcrR family transcriptional regulator, transcriptional repressor for nem operon